jgi:hypothetical protein
MRTLDLGALRNPRDHIAPGAREVTRELLHRRGTSINTATWVVPVKAIRALHLVLDDRSLHQAQLCLVWLRRRSVGGRRKREFAKRMQKERRLNGFASESRR